MNDKIGGLDDVLYLSVLIDGNIVNVPCAGMWRKFYKILGYELAINDMELERGINRDLFQYYDTDIKRKISEKLYDELESKIMVTDKRDPDRMVTRYTYKLSFTMIEPEELQALIQAALGDGDAKKKVVEMLLKLNGE